MDRRTALTTTMTFYAGLALGMSDATAQEKLMKDQLIGSWIFVSSTTEAEDGSPFWGANPKGLVIFTASGRYSTHLMRSDRPKFAANSRVKGTPVLGNVSSFGTYTIDEAKKTFTIRFEGSTYPNLEGTVQTRPFEIAGTSYGSPTRPRQQAVRRPTSCTGATSRNRLLRLGRNGAAYSAVLSRATMLPLCVGEPLCRCVRSHEGRGTKPVARRAALSGRTGPGLSRR